MPTPLRFALLDHLEAPRERPSGEVYTERIPLGTAIICLNLHPPLAIAEQVRPALGTISP